MSLEAFIPERRRREAPATVTIRTDGRFSFNAAASRTLAAFPNGRVVLFGDKESKHVEVRAAAHVPGLKSIRLTISSPSATTVRASFEGAAFLDWLGYDYGQPRKFTLSIHDNVLMFDATPELSLVAAKQPRDLAQ
jgi:hypothetical protein